MNLLYCQKLLLKTEAAKENNGRNVLEFTCEQSGLHFRLDPKDNPTHADKAASLCTQCERHCTLKFGSSRG